MERQAGLGRSLEDVLDSLTPVESDPLSPGRALFEPDDLEQQLDQLIDDVTALRERVQHLVALVPDDTVAASNDRSGNGHHKGQHKGQDKKEKKHKKRKQTKKLRAKDAKRRA